MKTAITAFSVVFVISVVGIWSCEQQKSTTQCRKIRDLEARYVKLEDDYRAVLASSESTRKKLARLEVQRAEQTQQIEELKLAVQERDELKQKLATCTNERDGAHNQLVQFSKELQSFATRVDAVASAPISSLGNGAPVATASPKTN